MILGLGNDLIRVARLERAHARFGPRLAERLLMEEERAEVLPHARPAQRLAKAFAAKEAFVKALGTGFVGVHYHDVGVVREASGRPRLIFSPAMAGRLTAAGIRACHLSLSDDGDYVLATVILEG